MIPSVYSAPFEPKHIDQIVPRSVYQSDTMLKPRVLALSENPTHRVRTIFCGEHPIALVAILFMWDGVGEVIAVTSEAVKNAPVSFHKLVLSMLSEHAQDMGLHRIQVTAKCDFTAGKRWIEALGFSLEGTLRQFGPDRSNYFIYGKVI